MARNDPTIYMRIPQELKDQLDAASEANRRSLTAEVVARLQQSFEEGRAIEQAAFEHGFESTGLKQEIERLSQRLESTDAKSIGAMLDLALAKRSLQDRLHNLTLELRHELQLGDHIFDQTTPLLQMSERGLNVDADMERLGTALAEQTLKVTALQDAITGLYREMDALGVWYVWDASERDGEFLLETTVRPSDWPPGLGEVHWLEPGQTALLTDRSTEKKTPQKTASPKSKN